MGKKSRRRNGRPRESVKSGMSKVTTESIIRNVEMNNVLGRSRSTASNEEIDPKNIKKFHMNVAIPPGVYPETFVRQKLAAANIDPNRLVDLEWDFISPEDANKENRSHMSDGKGLDHTPSETTRETTTTSTTDAKPSSNIRNNFIPRGFDSTGVPIPAGVDPETFFKKESTHTQA